MVAAVGVNVTQGTVLAAAKPTPAIRATQAYALAAINFPTKSLRATQSFVLGTVKATIGLRTTQATVLAAVRGRIANPRLRAWTFTLDGHDFYVLRLGDSETLVYDLSTEQWVNWDSFGLSFWRPNTGISWLGGQALAYQYGSNILCGDDTWGLLWFLNPLLPYDEHPDSTNPTQQIEFDRVVMGQVPSRGRGVTPCFAIFLTGDNYGNAITAFSPSITLDYSDDGGQNYVTAGTLSAGTDGDDNAALTYYSWYSLGHIDNPGRLFKITDNGIFTRIDDMKMNDD